MRKLLYTLARLELVDASWKIATGQVRPAAKHVLRAITLLEEMRVYPPSPSWQRVVASSRTNRT